MFTWHNFEGWDSIKSQGASHQPQSRGMKAAVAASVCIGGGVWPVVISTLIAGPVGFVVSAGLTAVGTGVASLITYGVTKYDE